ncbi:MAG: SIS domain-containing protein [Actinomycetota bacterium]
MSKEPGSSPSMLQEALEGPTVVDRLLRENRSEVEEIGRFLRRRPRSFAITVARGSSDHAAGYAKYLLETTLGLVTARAAPSVTTEYRAALQADRSLVIGLSQSGESPDVVETLSALRRAGGLAIAVTNREDGPLVQAADALLPLHAGPERSVAATKTFLGMLAALAQLVAAWNEDRGLMGHLAALPDALGAATEMDWSEGIEPLVEAPSLLTVGRGYAQPIAREVALKMKEVCGIHAEAFSAAEVLHGPVTLVGGDYPVFLAAPRDRPLPQLTELAADLRAKGAALLIASPETELLSLAAARLRMPPPLHPALDPAVLAQASYPFTVALASARGRDPDRRAT